MKLDFLIYCKILIVPGKYTTCYHSQRSYLLALVKQQSCILCSNTLHMKTELVGQKDGAIYTATLPNISTVGGPGLFKRISICIMFFIQQAPTYLQTLFCLSYQVQVLQYPGLAKPMWSMTNFAQKLPVPLLSKITTLFLIVSKPSQHSYFAVKIFLQVEKIQELENHQVPSSQSDCLSFSPCPLNNSISQIFCETLHDFCLKMYTIFPIFVKMAFTYKKRAKFEQSLEVW